MNIEFHTPYGKVSEKMITEIRKEIMEFARLNKKISRAEVVLREEPTIIAAENKICEIKLTVFGGDIVAYSRTENFKESIREAMKELRKMVKQQMKKLKEPQDQVVSTVSI
jgi:ribosome-associated translation inhibitor RaiA